LASLRSGQVTAKQAADYKAAFAKPTSPNMKTKSGETTITMRSGDYFITMRVKKEGRAFVLTSLSHRKSSRKSKR
jgi:mRNA-degrading endonuclease RelE of RelBE toxin-antitoxin system